jgi:hypothetical protein
MTMIYALSVKGNIGYAIISMPIVFSTRSKIAAKSGSLFLRRKYAEFFKMSLVA